MGHASGLAWSSALEGANRWENTSQLFFEVVARRHLAFFWGAANDGFNAGLTAP
jgi:hypothetical protein